jgi:hypothetical protein
MISNQRRNKSYLTAEQGADARYSAAQITVDKLLHICAYITIIYYYFSNIIQMSSSLMVYLFLVSCDVPAEVVMSIKKKCSPRGAVCMLYT